MIASANPEPITDDIATSEPGHLLIVEDDPRISGALSRLLQRRRWQVEVAETVERAVDHLRTAARKPDWIVLDLMLPDGSGEAVLREARRSCPECRVVVVSGAGNARLREVERLGAEAVLAKPVSIRELTEVLHRN